MGKIIIADVGGKKVRLDDKKYVASGGEGVVYRDGKTAIKIYHDSKKMIPAKKIDELSKLVHPNILGPRSVVYDDNGKPIGFSSPFVFDSHPLLKLFTKGFRGDHNFGTQDTIDLVKAIQETVVFVHGKKCLIVDMNEMNFLWKEKGNVPYFIDVDSWQTSSFKATALMESVRDPKVKNKEFSTMSDWYSFAIVIFQLYIGIHPYKGLHPDYKNKDWRQRMDDGVSVFDPRAILPSVCRSFNVIPKAHRNWFEQVFVNNDRSMPPFPDGVIPVAGTIMTTVIKTIAGFKTEKVGGYPERVVRVFSFGSENIIITSKCVYATSRKIAPILSDIDDCKKVLVCRGPRHPIVCMLKNGNVSLEECFTGEKISSFNTKDIMVRQGVLYSVGIDAILENRFMKSSNGGSILHTTRKISGATELSTKTFEGGFYQDLFGKPFFVIPFKEGSSWFQQIKELRGYRVLSAKSEDTILVVLTEKCGIYHRFVIVFDENFGGYTVRHTEDVALDDINFTKMPHGPCVLCVDDDKIEVFVGNGKVKEIEKAPFNPSMRLFNNAGIFFVNGREIQRVTMTK